MLNPLLRLTLGCELETKRLVQARGQGGQMAPLNQESDDPGKLFEDIVAIHRTLQVLLAAAPTGSNPAANHAPDHLEVAIAEVPQLFVDFDQRIEEREG